MVNLHPGEFVYDALNEMIVLTGIPRSGTSIFGQLVGSFATIEYAFQPPMVNYFDGNLRHGTISPETAAEMFFPYLYFDYFASYLHGRRYNFREKDFSYILGMKTLPEVLEQWRTIDGLSDAIKRAPEYTFAFKYPGFYKLLSVLYDVDPSMRVIDLGRNLSRIAASIYDKEWFFDYQLQPGSPGRWPYHQTEGIQAPYLVAENDITRWQKMSPATRTIYVCNRYAEDRLTFLDQYADRDTYKEIRYERFVNSPERVCEEVATFIGADPGHKTPDVIDSVRSTTASADIDEILAACDPSIREQFNELRPHFKQ